ncbi:DUF2889 domain-containing protein [Pseudomonas sp. PDM19]|uniref:DUF2889 domain-containing protein n=1 Tax=Pseudomonas sp. PDM19 TaxID=2769272 RepID=UPI0017841C11|nr:DUF2889 domain-containing protein [Pseudomonas sp. PDM19]MBD9629976.1 DUF2889 domain-containing protein [Pseudomonas sp. PDM19]
MTEGSTQDVRRRLLHTRQVICTGYQRDDGCVDIEGYLLDSKPEDTHTDYRLVAAGEAFHQMRLVLTVDSKFIIRAAHARTEAAPTPTCGEIAAAYEGLVGLRIGPGFKQQAIRVVGGLQGCTHLTELLGPMATTLIQSTFVARRDELRRQREEQPGFVQPRPWVIGSCHVYHPQSDASRRIWPQGFDERGDDVIASDRE